MVETNAWRALGGPPDPRSLPLALATDSGSAAILLLAAGGVQVRLGAGVAAGWGSGSLRFLKGRRNNPSLGRSPAARPVSRLRCCHLMAPLKQAPIGPLGIPRSSASAQLAAAAGGAAHV